MFGTSCILLCVAGVLSVQGSFSYLPWDLYRRSNQQCEMCYNSNCYVTDEARCEYYAETSKIIHDDDDDEDESKEEIGDKIDSMLFELVDTATSSSMFKVCVPYISQYTDCTEENICLGCQFCICNEEGKWVCKQKQQCRPEPELNIDQQKINIVIKNLNRKEKAQKNRIKRSVLTTGTDSKDKTSYKDISKWLYGVEPLNSKEKTIEATTLANDVDILEFNDILKSWSSEWSTQKSTKIIDNHKFSKSHDYETDYDPIRLVKRDTSVIETNETQPIVQFNSQDNNLTYDYDQILNDALYGLNKITNEKQIELEDLLSIQNNLVKIAKAHNVSININSTYSRDSYTKHHIAIYILDTFEKCMIKLKHHLYIAMEEIIRNELLSNSTDPKRDLRILLNTIKKDIFDEQENYTDSDTNNFIENNQTLRRNLEPDGDYQIFNPITSLNIILKEVNKSLNVTNSKTNNPLDILTPGVKKVLKRVIKLLYLEDFIIDIIVHETYYKFDAYMENIGIKWNKMIQDISSSESHDKLYKMKLLHLTLNVDIAKIEDTVTLLDFARNRRMTITNGVVIEESVIKIQNNLKAIDSKVQQIIKIQKSKRLKEANDSEKKKSSKKISMMQKLKNMFQNSKDDIKNMLRKKFPKSEIIRRITKKNVDELEKQRKFEYQETVNKWQDNLNRNLERKKRSAWVFHTMVDRLKSIIPGYLKGKVKKGMGSKANNSKTRLPRTHGRNKKKSPKATTMKSTPTKIELNTT